MTTNPSPPDWRGLCEELVGALDPSVVGRDGYGAIAALLPRARAVLARYGHQPTPPAEIDCPACEGVPKPGNQPCAVCGRSASSAGGEVAELAWWLRSLEDASVWFESGSPEVLKLTRAADLLEQRHPAPVPVADRLPGPEDCDAEGMCWWWDGEWGLVEQRFWDGEWGLVEQRFKDYHATHWLPATALPLPQGEVQP